MSGPSGSAATGGGKADFSGNWKLDTARTEVASPYARPLAWGHLIVSQSTTQMQVYERYRTVQGDDKNDGTVTLDFAGAETQSGKPGTIFVERHKVLTHDAGKMVVQMKLWDDTTFEHTWQFTDGGNTLSITEMEKSEDGDELWRRSVYQKVTEF